MHSLNVMKTNVPVAADDFRDMSLVDRRRVIETYCAGRSVLHLGCTNAPYTAESLVRGELLHADIGAVSTALTGLDSDANALKILEEAGWDDLILGDLENLGELELNRSYDVIVAGEIIEHLANPGRFLAGVRRFMNPSTVLIISTVNTYCGMRFARYALRGKRGKQEPVHPDHVSYYSYATLTALLARYDLSLENFYFYDLDVRLRPQTRWIIRAFNDISVFFTAHLSDGLIAVCKLGGDDA